MPITRRGFFKGCSAAIAAMAGARFNTLAFAGTEPNSEILIVLFLRGGMDGLSFLPPLEGPDRGFYESYRKELRIPANQLLRLSGQFGLHPQAAPLRDLFVDGKLAIVHNAGMHIPNRSHFDAMAQIELGTPGSAATTTGWLTRHLANLPGGILVPSLAISNLQPASLLGSPALNLANPYKFHIENGNVGWAPFQRDYLGDVYGSGDSWLHRSGRTALTGIDIIRARITENYEPANGAVYPGTSLGEHLKALAQLMKTDVGLQVATVELGGWDTHHLQAAPGSPTSGGFSLLLTELSTALAAFYQDLDGAGANNYTNRMTVVVQSEFGREVRENDDLGTEHGHGNLMLVLGGRVNGGFHGTWSGLHPDQLFEGTDLPVTTDYRRVLSEILIHRMNNPDIATIFPLYTGYQPLGVVQSLFRDDFESGDTGAWSAHVG